MAVSTLCTVTVFVAEYMAHHIMHMSLDATNSHLGKACLGATPATHLAYAAASGRGGGAPGDGARQHSGQHLQQCQWQRHRDGCRGLGDVDGRAAGRCLRGAERSGGQCACCRPCWRQEEGKEQARTQQEASAVNGFEVNALQSAAPLASPKMRAVSRHRPSTRRLLRGSYAHFAVGLFSTPRQRQGQLASCCSSRAQ